MTDSEQSRLQEAHENTKPWYRWGPYLSERQWGTVREDYSADGDAWDYFPHDHARSRAYRWNEDGLGGICDDRQWLCFALALWNGRDPILKERIFGLSNPEGNHGEDAKEYWWYLDSTPTHSFMRWRYMYPQAEFPYQRIIDENGRRTRADPEFELVDTGIFDDGRYCASGSRRTRGSATATSSACASAKPTSTTASCSDTRRPTSSSSAGRRSRGCSGRSSSTTTTCCTGCARWSAPIRATKAGGT